MTHLPEQTKHFPLQRGGLETNGIDVQTSMLRITGRCFRPPRLSAEQLHDRLHSGGLIR